MEKKDIPKIGVSKIDAARRQLETAIALYFHNEDPVSTHTLTAAAYDILQPLCKSAGIDALIKGSFAEMVREDKKDDYLRLINEAQNFFKHGGNDPHGLHVFRPATTEFMLWDACQMYQRLSTEIPKSIFIFSAWFYTNHTDFIADEKMRVELVGAGQVFNTSSRAAFYQDVSRAYDLRP